jgi:regulator of RNase E activity RraA
LRHKPRHSSSDGAVVVSGTGVTVCPGDIIAGEEDVMVERI